MYGCTIATCLVVHYVHMRSWSTRQAHAGCAACAECRACCWSCCPGVGVCRPPATPRPSDSALRSLCSEQGCSVQGLLIT